MLSDDVFYHLLCSLILLDSSFYEHISKVRIRYFLLCYLNLGTTLDLKLPDSLSTFANDEAHTIVRHGNDVGVWGRGTIRGHHAIIHHIDYRLLRIVKLSSHCQLLLSNLVPCCIIGCYDPLYCVLSSLHIFGRITYDKYMLIVIIVWLRCRPFLLGTLASNEDFASGFFLKSLLVETLRTYKHTNVIDTSIFR